MELNDKNAVVEAIDVLRELVVFLRSVDRKERSTVQTFACEYSRKIEDLVFEGDLMLRTEFPASGKVVHLHSNQRFT